MNRWKKDTSKVKFRCWPRDNASSLDAEELLLLSTVGLKTNNQLFGPEPFFLRARSRLNQPGVHLAYLSYPIPHRLFSMAIGRKKNMYLHSLEWAYIFNYSTWKRNKPTVVRYPRYLVCAGKKSFWYPGHILEWGRTTCPLYMSNSNIYSVGASFRARRGHLFGGVKDQVNGKENERGAPTTEFKLTAWFF